MSVLGMVGPTLENIVQVPPYWLWLNLKAMQRGSSVQLAEHALALGESNGEFTDSR